MCLSFSAFASRKHRIGLSVLFCLFFFPRPAAAGPADTVLRWLDNNGAETTKDKATYYRQIWKERKLFHVAEYYRSGQKHMSGAYSDKSLKTEEGEVAYYFENGQASSVSAYVHGKRTGTYTRFYENGQMADLEHYKKGRQDGAQTWYYHNSHKSEEAFYKAGRMVRTNLWGENGTPEPAGTTGETMAAFVGQNGETLNEYILSKIHYPDSARKAGRQGKVLVEFIVEKDGAVSECKVSKTSGLAAFDREGLRVVRAMPPWRPAKMHNRPARMYFTLPITFRLD